MDTSLNSTCKLIQQHIPTKNFLNSTAAKILENKNFNFTSGRSIAHMLPPIKPTLNEANDEKFMNNCGLFLDGSDTCLRSETCRPILETEPKILDLSQNTVTDSVIAKKEIKDKTNCMEEAYDHIKPWLGTELVFDDGMLNRKENSPSHCTEKISVPSDAKLERSPDKVGETRVNVQEYASSYKELDTYLLARKVKDVLVENNIGQRIFGQTVLGLTQGSVSDLLSHPKSWHTLSLKGREPFIRMQLWLDNPKNIEELKNLKLERTLDNGSGASKQTNLTSCATKRCQNVAPVKKKSRVVLSNEDKLILLQAYAVEPYPSHSTVEELAKKLNKKSSTVINWFHNYRSRVKRGFFASDDSNHESSAKRPRRDDGDKTTEAKSGNDSPLIAKPKPASPSASQGAEKNEVNQHSANPMLLTATVLLTSQTATPIWSFRVSESRNVLAPSDALKSLLLNVCSSRGDAGQAAANPGKGLGPVPAATSLSACEGDDDKEKC